MEYDSYILWFFKLNVKRADSRYMKIWEKKKKQKLHWPPRMFLCIQRWTTISSPLKAQWWQISWLDLDAVNSATGNIPPGTCSYIRFMYFARSSLPAHFFPVPFQLLQQECLSDQCASTVTSGPLSSSCFSRHYPSSSDWSGSRGYESGGSSKILQWLQPDLMWCHLVFWFGQWGKLPADSNPCPLKQSTVGK